MRNISLALLLIFTIFCTQITALNLNEKCELLKLKKGANPLIIETTLGTALSLLKKGSFSSAIEKVNDALVIFNSFDSISHPYTTHMSGTLFLMSVYNYEKLTVNELIRFKKFFQYSVSDGVYFKPYEEALGYTTLEILELEKAGKYSEAVTKIDFAFKILKNVSIFNFMIEQELILEIMDALQVKKADLLLLSGKIEDAYKLYNGLSENIKKRLLNMEIEGKNRLKTLNPGIIFDKDRTLAELYYSMAFTHIRVNKIQDAIDILTAGLKIIPSSNSLSSLKGLIKK